MMQYSAIYAMPGTPNQFQAFAPGLTIRNMDHLGRTAYLGLSPTGTVNMFPIQAGETVTIPLDTETTFYAWVNGPQGGSGEWVYLRYFTAGLIT